MRLDPGRPTSCSRGSTPSSPPRARASSRSTATRPAGFGYGDRMAEVFRELPVFRALRRAAFPSRYAALGARLVEAVLRGVARRRRRGGTPAVAIVDWAEVKTRADQEILREALRGARDRVPPRRSARRWRAARDASLAAGAPVDVVYRRAVLSELVRARERGARLPRGLSRAASAVFVNSFRCRLSEDKAFFALLTDEAFADL